MRSYIDITPKYMKAHRKRTVITIIGIVLAVSLFSAVSTLVLSDRDARIEGIKNRSGNYEVEFRQLDAGKVGIIINHTETSDYGIQKLMGALKLSVKNKEYNLELKGFNKSAYDRTFKNYFDIKEGRLPSDEAEIVIESRGLYSMGLKLGDDITLSGATGGEGTAVSGRLYNIVGAYEERAFSSEVFNGITFIKDESLKTPGMYNAFVNLKEKKEKLDVINRLAEELGLKIQGNSENSLVHMNHQLLSAECFFDRKLQSSSSWTIAAIIFLIVIVSSIAVIYNAFNISVMERIRQFGILRAIGATPDQIRRIVFREAVYMCLIAIPTGIIMGYATLTAILKSVRMLGQMNHDILKIRFYPEVILICSVVAVITIILSVWAPARSAGKVSPMDAVRNANEIINEEIRVRRTGLIRRLFKYEGDLAYRNIIRTPKRFWFTVSSLIISIVLLVVYSNFMNIIKQQSDRDRDISNADAVFHKVREAFDEEEISEIRNLKGVDKIYLMARNSCYFAFPKEYVNPLYVKKTGRVIRTIEGTDFIPTGNTMMSFYDDNGLETARKYLIAGKIDKAALEEMGVLLINKNRVIIGGSSREISIDYSNYKVGDKIVVPKLKAYPYDSRPKDQNQKPVDMLQEMKNSIINKDFYTFTVVGILDKDFLGGFPQDGIGLVFTEDVYKKINGNLASGSMLIKYKTKDSREELYEYFSKKAEQIGGYYYDYFKLAEEERQMESQVNLFVYGFITLIMLISSLNIINTIIICVMLRRREYACMRAIGMTKEQLTKMILYEGSIHGLIAAIVGIIIGGLLTRLIIYMTVPDIKVRLPFGILITGILGSILLTLIASVIPLIRLKKMNIVESLRME